MQYRRKIAEDVRVNAAALARERPPVTHRHNGDESRYRRSADGKPSYVANFTKCMPHDPATGLLVNPRDYEDWVRACDSGRESDFAGLHAGPPLAGSVNLAAGTYTLQAAANPAQPHTPPAIAWAGAHAGALQAAVRGWETQGAGLTYDLEGPDAHAVTMPPAPAFASQELVAEMAELYWMAYLRDVPFCDFDSHPELIDAGKSLAHFYWFVDDAGLSAQQEARFRHTDRLASAQARRRVLTTKKGKAIPATALFRGIAPGDEVGPYLSQFLLIGNPDIQPAIAPPAHAAADGYGAYGALRFDQRVRVATPQKNYMLNWEDWLDVQNGANVRLSETYEPGAWRFIATPRDLCTWVHYDALYQAYLDACLLLLGMGCPFDPGLPFQNQDFQDKQLGFATFGGPHILSLVTEVATRALKAVRFQKFNTHRRLRPETVGGELHQWQLNQVPEYAALDAMLAAFNGASGLKNTIDARQAAGPVSAWSPDTGLLLPMPFAEGSPSHTAYGSGHATVAGACVTILKAFFDSGWELPLGKQGDQYVAYVPEADGSALKQVLLDAPLTVEGELNKVASNIAVGRHWAGVHYFSDGYESLRLGEAVALGILEEQKLTYGENFSMSVPLFDGTTVRI